MRRMLVCPRPEVPVGHEAGAAGAPIQTAVPGRDRLRVGLGNICAAGPT